MRTPEILAPAGSEEALLAALRCGADAVYVGGKLFSARQNAANFDLPQLRRAVELCHLYGAKLYLTVNTLILEHEFPSLLQFLQETIEIGVDAFLVQDLGVLQLIRQLSPDVPIHASTQMTIHTPEGARWAKQHGISRVVVSRELSRQEIAAICQTGVEVEVFVHGALCMSVSGQCGLSAMIGSRSANRGRCAQACRLPFSAKGTKNTCALSLKDLCLVPYVAELTQDGVASLKIEGRCKRPEYVAAAVTALVQARAGEEPDLDTLRAVFSRSGFTDGYYTGKRQQMFGTRQKEDVMQAKEVLPRLAQLYQKPTPQVALTMQVTVQTRQPAVLTIQDIDGNRITVSGETVQPARTRATDAAQLERQLGKLGGTIYTLAELHADCDGVGMLPASAWNALRRDAIAAMDAARIASHTPHASIQPVQLAKPQQRQPQPQKFRIILPAWKDTSTALLEQPDTEALLLPAHTVSAEIPAIYRDKIYLTLPRFCADEKKLLVWLTQAKALGFSHIVCENVSHLQLGKQLGLILHGGMGLNAANPYCLTFLKEEALQDVILSPELTASQSKTCTGLPIGLYVYGHQPVMTMRNCPIRAEVGCRQCTHHLIDRTGREFPVYCDPAAGICTMYNAVPTWMADKPEAVSHGDFLVLDGTLCPDISAVLKAWRTGKTTAEPMTRGLFFRGVE